MLASSSVSMDMTVPPQSLLSCPGHGLQTWTCCQLTVCSPQSHNKGPWSARLLLQTRGMQGRRRGSRRSCTKEMKINQSIESSNQIHALVLKESFEVLPKLPKRPF